MMRTIGQQITTAVDTLDAKVLASIKDRRGGVPLEAAATRFGLEG
jgi:hypothetical protein